MSTTVPAALKTADINRFAQRAAQLEKLKPAIAYWCYYWIVKQILSKNLHNSNDECKAYITEVMDKLEQMKEQYPSDDAIVDDMAGQAYVEQFGLETFQRADNAVIANKASKQTAETYQAAAAFLDLLQIWGPLPPETAAKVKFAKYHALRIAKALKAGEDPNKSNPVREEVLPPADVMDLDPKDPEVQDIMGTQKPPSVERLGDEAPEAMVQDPPSDFTNYQPASVAAELDEVSQPANNPDFTLPSAATGPPTKHQPVSPMSDPNSRQGSIGGGYFPKLEHDENHDAYSSGPSAPPTDLTSPNGSLPPSAPPPLDTPSSFYSHGYMPTDTLTPTTHPANTSALSSSHNTAPPIPPIVPLPGANVQYRDDDVAVMEAQKHAKWAISALNFEDVPTAVKELRTALQALGAL